MARFVLKAIVNPFITIDRNQFPFTLPSLQNFNEIDLDSSVTFFTGENGSGKSTLMEAMAVHLGLPAEGGTKWHSYSTFDSHSGLHDQILLPRDAYPSESVFFRAESFYNLASYMYQSANDSGGVPRFGWTHQRSHGEGFLDAFLNLKPDGLYLMDEPESALSIRGQLTFLVQMQKLINEGSQLIIATHSPVILGFPNAKIYHFGDHGIRQIAYEESDAYLITMRYLRDPKSFSKLLGILDPDQPKSIFD